MTIMTRDMLRGMIGNNPNSDKWYDALVEKLPEYEIDTVERIAGFISQCAHESADFKRLEENLNYSAEALFRVFGKRYFKSVDAAQEYHRQPEKIANYVYMDKNRTKRGALGNVKEGDGWLFRGRGLKQLTGRTNYEKFGDSIGMTAEQAAEYVATEKGAVESACWFWKTNKLNRFADKKDIIGMTKKINGGTIGLEDRTKRWEKALDILGGRVKIASDNQRTDVTLSIGDRGDDVVALQRALGLNADGVFGPGTRRAVKTFQANRGLVADGVAGPKTLSELYG